MVPSGKAVGVGDATGVEVTVGVGDSTGVDNVAVTVSTGVEDVEVGDPTGVSDVEVAVSTGVSEVGVASTGVEDVEVGDPTGVSDVEVGVSNGVGVKVEVGASPLIVRLVLVAGRLVRILSPLEIRTLHSIAVCPDCRPVAWKVKAVPLVVALLPLLPAIATMKLPFCGSLIATAGSVPKRLVTWMLLICIKAEL
jgi:hypothetical protein